MEMKHTLAMQTLIKQTFLPEIYRILSISLGEPPRVFDWTYDTTDKVHHHERGLSPLEFGHRYTSLAADFDSLVTAVHDPRHPVGTWLSVEHLGNVHGKPVMFYNVDIQTIKTLCRRRLTQGEVVWIGVEVGKDSLRKLGSLDLELFDWDTLLLLQDDQKKQHLTKLQRLQYKESVMTHAMAFGGFTACPDNPEKVLNWLVLNSWGSKSGPNKGEYRMTDAWCTEHLYHAVLPRKEVLEMVPCVKPIEVQQLPHWDPLGNWYVRP
jgi:bleomycin hydrolase